MRWGPVAELPLLQWGEEKKKKPPPPPPPPRLLKQADSLGAMDASTWPLAEPAVY